MNLCARREAREPPARGCSLLTRAGPQALTCPPTPAQHLLSSRIPLPEPILSLLKESAPAPPYPAPAPTPPPSYGHRALGLPAGLPPPPETLTPQQAGLQLLPSAIPTASAGRKVGGHQQNPVRAPLLPSPPGSSFQAHRSLPPRPLCAPLLPSPPGSLFQLTGHSLPGPCGASPSLRSAGPARPGLCPWSSSLLTATLTPGRAHRPTGTEHHRSHTLLAQIPHPEPQAHLSAAHSTPFPACPRGTSNPTHIVQSSEICSVSGTDISVSPGHPAKTRVLILESALA